MHAMLFIRAQDAGYALDRPTLHYTNTSNTLLDNIMDILKSSTAAARHPSNVNPSSSPQPLADSSTVRYARSLGLDRPSTAIPRDLAESDRLSQFQRQIYRKWQPGDVYAPHDLSGSEQKKWKQGRKKPQQDAFDILGINPVLEYKVRKQHDRRGLRWIGDMDGHVGLSKANEWQNFTMMSEYMTEMGRIKHSRDTGLRPKNQRKIAKAIRRAVGLGLMPSVHRHPLVLKKSSPARFL